MSEENKNTEEVNPIDEYLQRYKEKRLAEFVFKKIRKSVIVRKKDRSLLNKLQI